MDRVILASASPRRRELLQLIFHEFDIIPTDCDESLPVGVDVKQIAQIIAQRKNDALGDVDSQTLVISCDTIVTIDGVVLGKPNDRSDAERMLRLLSNRTHQVISGVCLRYNGKTVAFSQITDVSFYELSDAEIFEYIDSNEPYDKAGGYGIQGGASLFVKSICGDYFNIVGLPVARLKKEIEALIGK